MNSRRRFLFLTLVVLVLVSSCTSAPQAAPNVAEEPSPTTKPLEATETGVPTSAPTDTMAPTLTQTYTSQPTFTLTPLSTFTITPTSAPDMPIPGIYKGGGCQTTSLSNNSNWNFACSKSWSVHGPNGCITGSYKSSISMDFCVVSVTVLKNRHLVFTVSWHLSGNLTFAEITKPSEKNNNTISISDNLGNRAKHINGGGVGYQSVNASKNPSFLAWFEFDPPKPGATDFQFHNGDIVISNMRLDAPLYLYKDYFTNQQQFALGYFNTDWDELTDETGLPYLYNKEMSTCTIREHPAGDLQGRLKDKKVLGKIAYDIYGFIDKEKNLGIREYVSTGFEGLDPANQPRFWVTIPMDTQQACIQSVSEMLTHLYKVEP